MTTLEIRGLFASLALSALFVVGSVATAHANGTDKEKEKKNETKVETKTLVSQWFSYTGPDSSNPNYEAEIENPSNYSPMSTPACTTGQELCSVFAENDGGHPSEASLGALKEQILKNQPQNPSEVRFEN